MNRSWMIGLAGLACITAGGTISAQGIPGNICTGPFVIGLGCPVQACVNVGAAMKICNGAGPWIAYNAVDSAGLATGTCQVDPTAGCILASCPKKFHNLVGAAVCTKFNVVCTENLLIGGGAC